MRRIPELDALRGLAALSVIHYHFAQLEHFPLGMYEGCWAAVDLFFVLSGYLITTIIIEEQSTPHFFLNFYARRTLRIWPLYYTALVVVITLNAFAGYPNPITGLGWYLVFLQNLPYYWNAQPPPFDWHFFHSWTLAVEEQFYLVWPVLIYLVGSRRIKPLCLVVMTASVIALHRGFSPWVLLTRCGGFALGGWLAATFSHQVSIRHKGATGARGYGLIRLWCVCSTLIPAVYLFGGRMAFGPHFLDGAVHTILAFSLMFFGIVGLIVLYSGHRRIGFLRHRLLGYLGRISFGIYVWHQSLFGPFKAMMDRAGINTPLLRYGFYCVATIAVASLSWHYFEAPILKFKDRFGYGGRPNNHNKQLISTTPSSVGGSSSCKFICHYSAFMAIAALSFRCL